MEVCKECECSCKPISIDCIIKNSDISDSTTIKDSLYQKATSDIDSLIGEDCAEAMCVALEQAAEQAQDNNETDIGPYLEDKWKNIISNRWFKLWYANKIQWHFLRGASTSEITANKLITLSSSDPTYKNDFQTAQEKERKRLEKTTQEYIGQYRDKFLRTYWNKNLSLYTCAEHPCGCKKDYICIKHKCNDKPDTIGMWIG